ncbi:hypothetical protein B0H14DRAFT_3155351 [Mycena olivaceomarginata]|nr:hypothetical protein B0H14DRAFT_3155351 [Mycena olivaceomarginata]
MPTTESSILQARRTGTQRSLSLRLRSTTRILDCCKFVLAPRSSPSHSIFPPAVIRFLAALLWHCIRNISLKPQKHHNFNKTIALFLLLVGSSSR